MTPWVKRLLLANGFMHLLATVYPVVYQYTMLRPALILVRPWTLITYMFVHAPGFMHILFNMIALFFFGPRLEARIGSSHFIRLYLVSGMAGAFLSLPFTPYAAIVGASGAVFGVMLGFAFFWPRERIYIWGILPIEARWLVILTTGMAIYFGFTGGGRVAHFAHLGGYIGGWIYLVLLQRRAQASRKAWESRVNAPAQQVDSDRIGEIDYTGVHPLNREELDRILDKIRATGLASLTVAERTFLSNFAPRAGNGGTTAPS
jgi:membrane associated rhomboid family serine protease